MATVYFYEKPGCINNIRQKALLASSGHQVVAGNLLIEAWQPEREALALMMENPLLIRRPLMQVGNSLMAGFDQQAVADWIGLTEIGAKQDMENCPRPLAQASCGHD